MTKVFITGIAGFLGSHLADYLVEKGYEVSGVDNLMGGYRKNISKDVCFYKADARNFSKMKKYLKSVEVVYHCAAAPHEGLSVFSPNIVTETTYNTTVGITSAAVSCGVKRIVFTSSMARYGEQIFPFTEDMTPKPQDPYGVAKYASELVIRSLCKAHGMEFNIAVPHNIIGTRQKYDDPFRNVVAIMINLMLQGRQPVIYGDGEQKRCFSFVDDVVEPLYKMGFFSGVVGEVINVGPDEEFVTINNLSKVIAKLMHFPLHPTYMLDRPMEVKMATCSAEKARKLLKYKTTHTLEEGVKEMVDWIREEGPKPFKYHIPLEIITDDTPKTWKEKFF